MTLSLSKSLVAGTPENIEDVQTMFNEVVAYVNSLTAAEFVPGDVVCQAMATVPAGWLLCDGAVVSRSTYSALFTAIGTAFGAGDGSTTFKLPDLRDSVPVGVSGTISLGAIGGAKAVTLLKADLPNTVPTEDYPSGIIGQTQVTVSASSGKYAPTVDGVGWGRCDGGSHSNMQPYVGMHWRIKT